MKALKITAAIAFGIVVLAAFANPDNRGSKAVSQPRAAVNEIELAKPSPDWNKVGTKLSERCAREIMAKRTSSYCEAEGKAWNEGLQAKLNDPRFRDYMEREFGRYMR
jgi:hypothetical protein